MGQEKLRCIFASLSLLCACAQSSTGDDYALDANDGVDVTVDTGARDVGRSTAGLVAAGLTDQTWPAGTHIATLPTQGRLATWHRGYWYITAAKAQSETVWDISNPAQPQLLNSFAGNSNGHDSVKIGDLYYRDYVQPVLAGSGSQWLDLSQLPNLVPYTGPDPEWGRSRTNPHPSAHPYEDEIYDIRGNRRLLIVGNIAIRYPENDEVAPIEAYDIGDPNNIQLLDSLSGVSLTQYTTSHHIYKHHLLLVGGSNTRVNGQEYELVGVDFSDPTNLRISYLIPDWPSRYVQFQDEFGFGAHFTAWKYNFETNQKVLEFSPPSGTPFFSDFHWNPVGHLLLGTGDTGAWIYSHQDTLDTRAPEVGYHLPRDGATNEPVTTRIGIVIHETLQDETVNGNTILVRPVGGGAAVEGLISTGGEDIITFAPQAPLAPNTTYEVTLVGGGIKDASGNGIQEFSFRFSTGNNVDGGSNPPPPPPPPPSNNPPIASFTLTPDNGQAPVMVTANGTASWDPDGDSLTFAWDFGDGTTATGSTATHTYNSAGNYTVRLTVSDGRGGVRAAARTIGITAEPGGNRAPIAQLQVTPEQGAAPLTVELNGYSSWDPDGDQLTHEWRVGNPPTVYASPTATHTFGEPGEHNVTLVVSDGQASGVAITTVVATGNTPPPPPDPPGSSLRVTLSTSAANAAAGGTMTLDAAATGGVPPYEYRWDFGEQERTPWGGDDTSSHVYNNAGNYQLLVQVRDAAGRIAAATGSVAIFRPASGSMPERSTPILVDERARRVWVANPDNDTVTVIDADMLTVTREITVCVRPESVARDSAGRIWVACRDSDSVWVLDGETLGKVAELQLEWGSAPIAIVFDPTGTTAYIAEHGKSRVTRVDAAAAVSDNAPESEAVLLDASPRALAMSGDGRRLLVTRFISEDAGGTVWGIDLPSFTMGAPVSLPSDTTSFDSSNAARGVPNYLTGLTMDPFSEEVWVVAKKDNIFAGMFRDGTLLTQETSIRSLIARAGVYESEDEASARIDIDDHGQPAAVAFSPLGNHVLVAMQGNNHVIAIDPFIGAEVAQADTGLAPQGLAVDAATGRIFTKDLMSRTVTVLDGAPLMERGEATLEQVAQIQSVQVELLANDVLLGKQIFYNAADPRMTSDGYISCGSCHLDGGHDGRTWDFTQRGEGLRNTTTLRGQAGDTRGRVHWSGNFDEIQDFEHDIRGAFGGSGFLADADFEAGTRNEPLGDAKEGLSPDLDALAAYVNSLQASGRSPYRNEDGTLTDDAVAGQEIFDRLECGSCHAGNEMSDSALGIRHDVGTLQEHSGQRLGGPLDGLDTPALLGLWETAPYLHDGSAATLRDVLLSNNGDGIHADMSSMSPLEVNQLVAFLEQIEQGSNAAVPRQGAADALQGACVVSAAGAGEGNGLAWLLVAAAVVAGRRRRRQ